MLPGLSFEPFLLAILSFPDLMEPKVERERESDYNNLLTVLIISFTF